MSLMEQRRFIFDDFLGSRETLACDLLEIESKGLDLKA